MNTNNDFENSINESSENSGKDIAAKVRSSAGAAVSGAAKASGRALKKGAQLTGKALETGAKATGKAVVGGAKLTGKALETGAKATGKAVVGGAKLTGKALETGAKATGKAVVGGAKLTGKALETGVKATGKAVVGGAKLTGKALETGAKATGKAVGSAVQKTGKALSKSSDKTPDKSSAKNSSKATKGSKRALAKSSKGKALTPKKAPSLKNRIVAGLAVFTAVASIATGTAFDTPSEIFEDSEQIAVVEQVTAEAGNAAELVIDTDTKRRPAAKKGFKGWVQSLPSAVKLFTALPLYIVGTIASNLVSTLLMSVAGPAAAAVAKWAVIAVLLYGICALTLKAIDPDASLRDMFRLKNVLLVALAAAIIVAFDYAMPMVLKDYGLLADVVKYTVGTIVAISFIVPVVVSTFKKLKNRKAA